MKLVVGLGNPGERYREHRHNIGSIVVQEIGKEKKVIWNEKKSRYLYGKFLLPDNEVVILAKNMTYMNLSGEAVREIYDKFQGVNLEDIVVVCDDIDLDFGKLRIRKKGSAGGHNGLKSVIQCLRSQDFIRVKLGIGRGNQNIQRHVLSDFSRLEKKDLPFLIDCGKRSVLSVITESVEVAMNQFNHFNQLNHFNHFNQ